MRSKFSLKVSSATLLPKRNRTGTFTYIVEGNPQAMKFFAEVQGDAIVVDPKTKQVKWFHGEWFPSANIVLKPNYDELPDGTNPWMIDMSSVTPSAMQIAIQASLAMQSMQPVRDDSNDYEESDEDTDNQEADLEEPTPPVTTKTTTRRLQRK